MSLSLLLTLGVVLGGIPAVEGAQAPISPEGVTHLEGHWELSRAEGVWGPVRVPGNLSFQGPIGDGVVWLRLTLLVPEGFDPGDAALRLPMTSNAYEVVFNGTVVGGRGRIGPAGELLEKDLRAGVFRVPSALVRRGAPNTLALRLRTFYGNGGVMAPGVFFGPEAEVRDEHERQMARRALLCSLFFFAGFFHLVLFAGRRRERHHLWFALATFSLASVTAGIGTLGYLLTSNSDFNAYLVFVPLMTLSSWLLAFFSDFFERPAPRLRNLAAVWSAGSVGTLVASTFYNPLYPLVERVVLPASLVVLSGVLALCIWWTVLAYRAHRTGARSILVGAGAYAVSGVLELAWTLDLTPFQVDSDLGFAAFVGATVAGIASRYAWLHRQVEQGQRDGLTGCLTRAALNDHLARAQADLSSGTATISCIIVDLDRFKDINDTYGHHGGDVVLRAVGRVLRDALRASDLVSRWGGEEFLVLLPGSTEGIALEIATRLRASLKNLRFEEIAGGGVTASMGIASRKPEESFETWVARADQALYEGKRGGRDCIRMAAERLAVTGPAAPPSA